MPTYTYECPKHGEFDAVAPMCDSAKPHRCAQCRRMARRVITATQYRVQDDWSLENGGRGRAITQISDKVYARAPHEVPDLAYRHGFSHVEKAT